MKLYWLVAVVVACAGCQKTKTQQYTLMTDRAWPIGEARYCSLDGKYYQAHCFPPAQLSEPKTKYLVHVDLDDSIEFDKDQWAGVKLNSIICRLDSYEHATCKVAP